MPSPISVRSPGSGRRFVVAFNRDRDFYQVPLALAEGDMLECLVTDYYASQWKDRWLPGLRHRRAAGLPAEHTQGSLWAMLLQVFGSRLGTNPEDLFWRVDTHLGRMAAHAAVKADADLFLYSLYAYEAFTDSRLQDRLKILYSFHPHWKLIYSILEQDQQRYPEFRWTILETAKPKRNEQREDEELRRADLVFCASSFSKRSLTHIGMTQSSIAVVPYGITAEPVTTETVRDFGECRFLFVGQGIQRKGLHHLLAAWNRLAFPNASLSLVCSRMDSALTHLIGPGVRVLSNISKTDLSSEFRRAHIFIMPSLVEGFGLVYLEALNAGCYVIGTENTGLPDLNIPSEFCGMATAGDQQSLMQTMESAYATHASGSLPHHEITQFSRTLPWSTFRASIREQVQRFRSGHSCAK